MLALEQRRDGSNKPCRANTSKSLRSATRGMLKYKAGCRGIRITKCSAGSQQRHKIAQESARLPRQTERVIARYWLSSSGEADLQPHGNAAPVTDGRKGKPLP